MDFKILYEDNDVLALDKLAGIVVFPEGKAIGNTVIDALVGQFPELKNVGEAPRYGVVHRLDKDTSGLLLVAKTPKALIFLQKEFKSRRVGKKYFALVCGQVKGDHGTIASFMGRSPGNFKKQTVFEGDDLPADAREAKTAYRVLDRFEKFTLLEMEIETGRRHQIRCHLAHIHHPVAGDRLYGFKDSPIPEGLNRQFLHASYIKIQLPSGQTKEFYSDLPKDLQAIIKNLEHGDVVF